MMRPRVPEPMVMDDAEAVAAFDAAHPIIQAPIYRLNALALSRLLPEGGHLLDLGSGTGRLLADLARERPDITIRGRDLAPTMVATGREMLAAAGLADRVRLDIGDMTRVEQVPEGIDVVSCIWALHHLPTDEDALACLREIARLRAEHGTGVWIFDFARLPSPDIFPAVMDAVPGVDDRLRADGLASEAAAWTADELEPMLDTAGLGDLRGGAEQRLGHLQAWTTGLPAGNPAHERLWTPEPLQPPPAAELAERLVAGLPVFAEPAARTADALRPV